MRRLLLAIAGLALIACSTTPNRERARQGGVGGSTATTIPGFERQPNESVMEYDLTRDGKPDVWTYVLRGPGGKETLLRKEKDLNVDGKVDTWEQYAPDGRIARLVHDLDFDGRADITLYYERGELVRKGMAFGHNGVPRTWSYYSKGKLVRKERDTNSDGKLDTWEHWENGEIERIGVDQDGDGQVDRWEALRKLTLAAPVHSQK